MFKGFQDWLHEWRDIRVIKRLAKSKKQPTKKQHFVPQCYLKGFANDGSIWVFDKRGQRTFCSTIRDIGHENYFYDLQFDVDPKSAVGLFKKAQLAERALAEIDGEFASCLARLLKIAPGEEFSDELRRDAIFHVGIQYLRTREGRERILAAYRAMHTEMARILHSDEFPELLDQNLRISPAPEYESALHIKLIFDPSGWRDIAAALEHHFCYMLDTKGYAPVVTSDHPVAVDNLAEPSPIRGVGLASYGAQITLPISPTRILVFVESSFSKEAAPLHLKCVRAPASSVEVSNRAQLRSSHRWLFCGEDRFDYVRKSIEQFPVLGEERVTRVTVSFGRDERKY